MHKFSLFFQEFEDSRDADDAVYEMNGRELLGARVSVEHARGIPRRGDYFRERRPPPSWNDRSVIMSIVELPLYEPCIGH